MQSKAEILEAWYDTEKQKLFEKYFKMLEQGKPEAEREYKARMQALRQKFTSKSEKLLLEEKNSIGKKPLLPLIEENWGKIIALFNER